MTKAKLTKTKDRRIAMLFVSPGGFAALFKTGMKFRANTAIVKGLPKDAEAQYCFSDPQRAGVMIMIWSSEYEIVPEGHMPPIIPITIGV